MIGYHGRVKTGRLKITPLTLWIGILTAIGMLIFALALVPPVFPLLAGLGVLIMLPGLIFVAFQVLFRLYEKVR